MSRGVFKADSVKVARIEVDFLQIPAKLKVQAGLVNETTGQTLAWTDAAAVMWSDATREKLLELIASMEDDLASALFVGEVVPSESATVQSGLKIAGLSEHLGEAAPDAPSI